MDSKTKGDSEHTALGRGGEGGRGESRKEDAESQGLFECRAASKLSQLNSGEAAKTSCWVH